LLIGGAGFSGLKTVAHLWASGTTGDLALTPDPGFEVVLNSLDVAARFTAIPNQTVRVLDASSHLLWELSPFTVPLAVLSLAPNIVAIDTIHLQFGPGDFGISNINFDERRIPAPVPEPSTVALIALGIVMVWSARRSACSKRSVRLI
jgi:hypothetical protein